MKRMIDGVITCLAESGGCELYDDGAIVASIAFRFPEGYWPISLSSKPFSIMPGHVNHGEETDVNNWCFNDNESPEWSNVGFSSDVINAGYGYNSITYNFTFDNATKRTAFLKRLYGKDITGPEDSLTPFAVPVSMFLVAFDGRIEY